MTFEQWLEKKAKGKYELMKWNMSEIDKQSVILLLERAFEAGVAHGEQVTQGVEERGKFLEDLEEATQKYDLLDDYQSDNYFQFIVDMHRAGISLRHYNGRNYYRGPAVVVRSIQDAMMHTKVPCQWDNMGLDFVVYPK